ncbi:hypothetical protein [Caballeronia grimmiae]|uniref:Uncharacterized protein n=1 Tax=Caballeronia grimmiae TaxID=1071679 RepID=A0A069NP39_9BURK|nr:hypothetical protein [Caballeronia grimmiae]KDR29359.1 hypothetical protein BG57_18115 [Caballeronia grimmiae]GGD94151.1 hypothetical protein GCM10010985_56000 [Caballeronia grimmiae]
MTRKMLIKVTVDEALFPELYQRLDEHNPRLRAAVLRSLANDTARNAIGGRELTSAGKGGRLPAYAELSVEAVSAPSASALPVSSTTMIANPAVCSGATDHDVVTLLSHRFNVDEIADQFAGF